MSGLRSGLCSVTFRQLGVHEVASLAATAGLEVIEWGGAVHVTDEATARTARAAAEDAGLEVCSFGSYLSCDEHGVKSIEAILDVAEALGTAVVRVWAPWGITPDAPAEERARVADHLAAMAQAAAGRAMMLYLEFHGDTLTSSATSAAALADAVESTVVGCGWQPPYWAPQSEAADVADLALLAPRLAHVHAYAWSPDATRHPLAVEAERWRVRLAALAAVPTGPLPAERAVLLEFVAGDDPANLAADAAALNDWLQEAA